MDLHHGDDAGSRPPDTALRKAEADLAQEISDHGQTTKDLQESRFLLASSLEAQEGTIIFCIDRDYRYLFFNRAHAEVMKHAYGAEVAAGACVLDLITDPDDRVAAKDNYDRALAGESHGNVRVYGDVARAWYESFFNPLRDGSGEIIGATGLARDITERKLAEERLRDSEEDFRVLAEAVPQIVWMTTPDGKNTYFNQRWVDYTGMTFEESRGDGWNIPFHPDDRERAWEAWQRAVRDDAIYSLECRLRRADGAYRWWLVRGAPLRDESGAIVKWFGTCTDIDDLKTAEERLAQMTRLYATLSQVNQTIVRVKQPAELYPAICDVAVEFGEFSLAWIGLFDAASGDIRPVAANGLDVADWPFEVVNINAGVSRDGLAATAVRTGQIATSEDAESDARMRAILPHIKGRDYHSAAAIPFRLKGETTGVLVLVSQRTGLFREASEAGLLAEMGLDISFALDHMAGEAERALGEIALRESEERYRQLFQAESDALLLVDQTTNEILDANATASAMYGYSPDELLGMNVLQLSAEPELSQKAIDSVRRGETSTVPFRLHRRKDGSEFPIEVTARVFELQGRLVRVAAVRDVSQREAATQEIRRLNAELEERVQARTAQLDAANKELESFAYSISHDLRTPLRAIDGFTQMVIEDAAERLDADDAEHLNRARAAAQRMARLIDDLLSLSRASRQEMHVEAVDVSVLASEVLSELRDAEPQRSVETKVASGMRAEADPVLLRAILANLLSNAWKFTGRHETAHIEVGVAEQAGVQVFFVRDDGAGFDAENATHLFGAFQRMHTSDQFEGDGIGLATVQRLVSRHGGLVWAESKVEEGATFYFTLPGELDLS